VVDDLVRPVLRVGSKGKGGRSFKSNFLDQLAEEKYPVFEIATNPGDWVLDSFAGSGTTGAVAHKMGRRWIMVELGEHCHTHIIPRLKKVIDSEDPGGVTEAVGWKGGGGSGWKSTSRCSLVSRPTRRA
jgi:hypothetical protein